MSDCECACLCLASAAVSDTYVCSVHGPLIRLVGVSDIYLLRCVSGVEVCGGTP